MFSSVRSILRKAAAFFTAVVLALSGLTFGNNLKIHRPEDAALVVAMAADTHVGTEFYRRAVFRPCVRDVARHVKPDVLLIAGDCTDNGNEENWEAFSALLEKYPSNAERILALGNHDCWVSYSGGHDYAPAKENYLKYANALMETQSDTVWFTREIGGYSFIVLGSEDATTGATISENQLDWLEGELEKAEEKRPGGPFFVVNHQPLNDTHGAGKNEDGNGFEDDAASRRLLSILDRHKNVVFISGHQHKGLTLGPEKDLTGFSSVEKIGQHVTGVNLPCCEYGTFLEGGTQVLGQGLVMFVFNDRIELKGRNYFLSNWIRNAEITVPLE